MSNYEDIQDILGPLKEQKLNVLTERIIGCAIEVHKTLGPGLLESLYENALCFEFEQNRLRYDRQIEMPAIYKGQALGLYRLDLIVEDEIILELKAVEVVNPVYQAQLLSYLRITGKKLGLLINFKVPFLKDGVKRIINS
jgi:GxxExxY protein